MSGLILTDGGEIKEVAGHMISRGNGVANCYAQTTHSTNGPQTKEQAMGYMREMQRQQRREQAEYGK